MKFVQEKIQEEFTVRRIANHFLQHQRDYIKKEYRFVTGKIFWLAKSTRPDLNYTAFQMSKKNTNTTIADLRDANRVLKKVRERDSHLRFGKIGKREELIVMGIEDACFKTEAKAVGVFLSCSCQTRR